MIKQLIATNLMFAAMISSAHAGVKASCTVLESAPGAKGPNAEYKVEIDLKDDFLSETQVFRLIKAFGWHYGKLGKYSSIQMSPTVEAMFEDPTLENVTFAASSDTEPTINLLSAKYGYATIKCREIAK